MRLIGSLKTRIGRVVLAIRARMRLVSSITVGAAVFCALPHTLSTSTRALLTWNLTAGLYLGLAWFLIARASVSRTRWGARIPPARPIKVNTPSQIRA